MNKNARKIINHVSYILKYIAESDKIPSFSGKEVKVVYDLCWTKAKIYFKSTEHNKGEKYYNYTFIDKLVELSDKYGITYKIGTDENFEMHILISAY